MGGRGDYIIKCFMDCTIKKYYLVLSHQEKGDGLGIWHELQTGELHNNLAGGHKVKRPLGRPRHR